MGIADIKNHRFFINACFILVFILLCSSNNFILMSLVSDGWKHETACNIYWGSWQSWCQGARSTLRELALFQYLKNPNNFNHLKEENFLRNPVFWRRASYWRCNCWVIKGSRMYFALEVKIWPFMKVCCRSQSEHPLIDMLLAPSLFYNFL